MISKYLYKLCRNFPLVQKQLRRLLFKLPHRKKQVIHFDQKLLVDPTEMSGFYLYYEDEHDDYIFKYLDLIAPSYSIALDIGANIGVYTVFLASRVEKVYAFEPDSSLVNEIRNNLMINRLRMWTYMRHA